MEVFLVILVLSIMTIIYLSRESKKKKDKERRIQAATEYMMDIQRVLEKAATLKTIGAKINNYAKAEKMLLESQYFEECREVVTNYDELLDRIPRIRKVLPIITLIEKSYLYRFKKKHNLELNSLLDAIYKIKNMSITNEDFSVAEMMPEGTGEIVTIEGIEARLRELGWEEDDFK